MRHLILAIFVAAALTAGAAAQTPTTAQSQPAASASLDERTRQYVLDMIQLVRDTDRPAVALAAYARANAIERNSARLHEAFMLKMLSWGLTDHAHNAARNLLLVEGGHQLAHGVIGYRRGLEGALPEAFEATMAAIGDHAENPGILNNAGQLAAWLDLQKTPPAVAAQARRQLEQARAGLMKAPAFRDAYNGIAAAQAQVDKERADIEKELTALADKQAQVRASAAQLEQQLREINRQIDDRQRSADRLRQDLRSGANRYVIVDGQVVSTYPRYDDWSVRQQILLQIAREEQAVTELRSQARQVRSQLGPLEQQQTLIAEQMQQRQSLLAEPDRIIRRHMRWDPPAVNGKITPPRQYLPGSTEVKLPPPPEDPAVVAQRRLDLAKLYIENNRPDAARAVLTELLEHYPQTPAARQGQQVLRSLPAGPAN